MEINTIATLALALVFVAKWGYEMMKAQNRNGSGAVLTKPAGPYCLLGGSLVDQIADIHRWGKENRERTAELLDKVDAACTALEASTTALGASTRATRELINELRGPGA